MEDNAIVDKWLKYIVEDILKRDNFNIYEKAVLMEHLKKRRNISTDRAFAKYLGIPHTTLHHIIKPCRELTDKNYRHLRNNGFSDGEINKILRKEKPKDLDQYTDIHSTLDKISKELNPFISQARGNKIQDRIKARKQIEDLRDKLKRIQDILNHIEMYLER